MSFYHHQQLSTDLSEKSEISIRVVLRRDYKNIMGGFSHTPEFTRNNYKMPEISVISLFVIILECHVKTRFLHFCKYLIVNSHGTYSQLNPHNPEPIYEKSSYRYFTTKFLTSSLASVNIESFGVENAQLTELWSLDENTLQRLVNDYGKVHSLIYSNGNPISRRHRVANKTPPIAASHL